MYIRKYIKSLWLDIYFIEYTGNKQCFVAFLWNKSA